MNKKLLGTAVIAVSAAAFTSGCGILEAVPDVSMPEGLRFDTNTYVVQPGDTLESVASRYEIDPDSLVDVNSLELARLVPGQRLILLRSEDGRSRAARPGTEVPINSVPASAGQPIPVPNATQTTVSASPEPVADPTVIRSDVITRNQGNANSEEIIGVVTNDELIEEQPIFVAETDNLPTLPEPQALPQPQAPSTGETQIAAVERERPQGVETIIQEVKINPTVSTMAAPAVNSATAGTIEDIDPGPGAAVQAAADGEVVYSGRDLASHGNLVILRHDDNFLSAYSKVSDIFVKENQKVKAGESIASVGGAGSNSNEIHFEIRRNGEPVNPIDYLPAQ